MGEKMNAVTDAEFDSTVLKSDKPVLVDFWAEWCGPCRQVSPILEELAGEHSDKLTFLKMNAVTDSEFDQTVLKSDKPVLVDFWAEWCGPCRQVSPILEELNQDHGDKLTFLKMNVDENPVVPSSYRVNGIPTINVYQGGEVVRSIVGARPKAAILKELEGLI